MIINKEEIDVSVNVLKGPVIGTVDSDNIEIEVGLIETIGDSDIDVISLGVNIPGIPQSTGDAVWGQITGNIEDQTDLNAILNTKECVLQLKFTYTSSSPLTITILENGDFVTNASVDICTAFDDPAASISIGTPADNGKLLSSNYVRPTRAGLYRRIANTEFTATENINLYINPGASTIGNGIVSVYINKKD